MVLFIFVSAKTNNIMNSNLGSSGMVAEIEARIQLLMSALGEGFDVDETPTTAHSLEEYEQSWHSQARELSDLMTARQVQKVLDSDEFKEEVRQFVALQPGRLKNFGGRAVKVRFIGGTVITLWVSYYARKCDEKKRKGLYPGLCLLGIHERCSPALASQISLTSAALGSLQEAQHMLANCGCKLNIKTLRTIVKRFSVRARLAQAQESEFPQQYWNTQTLKGRRVVVSTDGGRLRVRTNKRGPKTKKGYRRYHTDWREPKLLIIYVVDEKGSQDKTFCPYLDGTLKGPDAVFGLLAYYLKKLEVSGADKLLFVADGALWIWERVKSLLQTLKLKPEQLFELIDFYHAVEHLSEFAKLKARWSKTQRQAWVRKHRHHLRQGHISLVIDAVKSASKGSRNPLLRRERDYFIKNQSRMRYQQVARWQLPIGSGAMESSIRRVVNLRLKGAGIYWLEESANEMLMLRCYYKAGRWDMMKKLAFQVQV